MQCHECGRTVEVDDRFCNGCGISLEGVTEPTASMTPVPWVDDRPTGAATDDPVRQPAHDPAGDPTDAAVRTGQLAATELVEHVPSDGWDDDDPVWAATGAIPTTDDPAPDDTTAPSTGDLPTTEPITEVWMDPVDAGPVTRAQPATEAAPVTSSYDAVARATPAMPVQTPAGAAVPDHRYRFSIVTMLGAVGGLVLLVAMFATVVEVKSTASLVIGDDAPAAFRTGTWIADDLADNLSIAGLLAALVMVVGGVAAAFGWRWGSGLAGGGGLAAAGLGALVVGLAQIPIDAAHEFAAIPSDQQFTLTITKALGYWLMVAAGALGIVVFFASSNDAIGDHRSGLNPWIAALGALAVVIAAAGPLLPDGAAAFSDNWYVYDRPGEPPAMLVAMRLAHLGLFSLGGVIGFLSVRRWGLGVAFGATFPSVWLGVSTLFEIGNGPVGPGWRNPGAVDNSLHGVTIIGLSAILAMAILGAVAAYDQSARERR